jgi:hypothetical protein
MHGPRDYLAATLLGLAALTQGCRDGPAAPATGAIEIRVSTTSESVDIDPDGYYVDIDHLPGQVIGINGTVTFGALRSGRHLVGLNGLSPNCSVSETNPRWVDAGPAGAGTLATFAVQCRETFGIGAWDYWRSVPTPQAASMQR